MGRQGFNDDREWIRPDLRQVRFAWQRETKGELLDRRNTLRFNASAVTSRIDAILPDARQKDGVESM